MRRPDLTEGEILRAVEICHSYKDNEVLRDISLCVSKGEILGVSGDNGAGKTTLLSILAGVTRPLSGEVFICGQNALKNRKLFSEHVGYVPQEDPLLSDVTVLDNMKLWGRPKEELISAFGLSDVLRKKAGTLSGGMKRRLSIVCALERTCSLLVLDEPNAGIDREQRRQIQDLIRGIAEEGTAVVMSSHLEEDLEICGRVLEIPDTGRV